MPNDKMEQSIIDQLNRLIDKVDKIAEAVSDIKPLQIQVNNQDQRITKKTEEIKEIAKQQAAMEKAVWRNSQINKVIIWGSSVIAIAVVTLIVEKVGNLINN